jgi:hypothetical protein
MRGNWKWGQYNHIIVGRNSDFARTLRKLKAFGRELGFIKNHTPRNINVLSLGIKAPIPSLIGIISYKNARLVAKRKFVIHIWAQKRVGQTTKSMHEAIVQSFAKKYGIRRPMV